MSRSGAIPMTESGSRTLYRDAALTDARSPELRLGVSVLVEDDRITWIRPSDEEGALAAWARSGDGDRATLEVVDASGTTIVPSMVDSHSHVTLPGGAHWIERVSDPPEVLLRPEPYDGSLPWAILVRGGRIAWIGPRMDAPDADAANRVHREAHGLVADAIYPVVEGQ